MKIALITFLGGILTVLAGLGLIHYLSGESQIAPSRFSPEQNLSEPPGKPKSVVVAKPVDDSLVAPPIRRAYPESIKVNIRNRLTEMNYSELNRKLGSLQQESKSGSAEEDALWRAYEAFQLAGESYDVLLTQWIDATPHEYQPYLARAYYYYEQAWKARGDDWASETRPEQISMMRARLDQARSDIAAALKIDDQVLPAFALLISIHSVLAQRAAAKNVLDRALEIDPLNYPLRVRYLNFMAPRWGGSYQQMEAFVKESMIHADRNPRLKQLSGLVFNAAARDQATVRAFSKAEELNTRALGYGDNDNVYRARGRDRFRQKEYSQALIDFDRAIALDPEDSENYLWRSLAQANLENYVESVADIMRANVLNPEGRDIANQIDWLERRLVFQGYELKKIVS